MESSQNMMRTMEPKKLFIKYLFPSLLGMALMAINILIDGLFVSHGVGEQGLAGVNIAVPIYSVILSVSLWIGMGGGTLYSIAHGENKPRHAKEIFTQSIMLATITTGIIILICLIFEESLAYLFGANDAIYPYVEGYLHIILVFGLAFVFENILSIFVRNDGNPTLAMMGLIVTSVVNIILNYIFIFIFDWGVEGAALASVIGAVVGIIVLLLHFCTKKNQLAFVKIKRDLPLLGSVLSIGFPSFIVEATMAVMMVAFNVTFGYFVGEKGLVAYAVVNYMHTVFLMLFIGLASSLQPIASYHYGARLFERMKHFVKIAVFSGFLLGVVVFFLGIIGKGVITDLFNVHEPDIKAYTEKGIVYFFSGYLFLGVNMVYVIYYQSIGRTRIASWLTLFRSIIFFIPFLILMPIVFNNSAIWFVFPIAEGLTVLLIYLAIKFNGMELIPRMRSKMIRRSR